MILDNLSEIMLRFFEWSSGIASFVVNWYINNGRAIIDVFHIGFTYTFRTLLVLTVLVTMAYLALTVASFTVKKSKRPKPMTDKEAPTLAVHIPARNEIVALECAQACLESDYPMDKLKIYIGDDSNIPSISKKLKAFADMHKNVMYLKRKKNIGFKPGNLNNMLKYTKEDVIVIFDSDFLPQKHFLRDLITPLAKDKTLHATQARWEPRNYNQNFTAALATSINDIFHRVALPVMNKYFGSGVLCGSAEAIRRSKLLELGGWQSGSLTEDIEATVRMILKDNPIKYLGYLSCELEVPHRPMDYFKQQMRWAYGVVTALREHFKEFFRVKTEKVKPKAIGATLGLGYVLMSLLFLLTISGTLSFVTHPPGPLNIGIFMQETLFNLFITSGLLISIVIALVKASRIKLVGKVFLSSFSIGLLTIGFVCNGIARSFSNGEMEWYLLKKKGKETIATQN